MDQLTSFFIDSYGQILWISVGGVAFAILFLVVGVMRVIEFSDLGLTKAKTLLLQVLHVMGCLLLSSALVTISTERAQNQRALSFSLLVSALILFVPGQVTIALIRRKQIRESQKK
jgi:heme/copper-type cytochrome/quinol oxidase subunit 3